MNPPSDLIEADTPTIRVGDTLTIPLRPRRRGLAAMLERAGVLQPKPTALHTFVVTASATSDTSPQP